MLKKVVSLILILLFAFLSLSACCCKAFVFSSRPILLTSGTIDYNSTTVLFTAEEGRTRVMTVKVTIKTDDEKI